MATQAELQTRLDNLEAAFDEGVLTVQYKGRTVTYRSVQEMKQVMDSLRQRLGTTTSRTISLTTDRGY